MPTTYWARNRACMRCEGAAQAQRSCCESHERAVPFCVFAEFTSHAHDVHKRKARKHDNAIVLNSYEKQRRVFQGLERKPRDSHSA